MTFRSYWSRFCLPLVFALAMAACATPASWDRTSARAVDRSLAQAKSAAPQIPPPAVTGALLPPLVPLAPEAGAKPSEPRFDLTVSNAPARQVFMGLVEGTGYSMVVHPDVRGIISLKLKNVTVPEAIETIRQVYGYDYRREGKRFLILPPGLQTRLFTVNYLN